MKKSLLLILFVSLLLSNAEAAPIQWDVASGGNGHYYELVRTRSSVTWEGANKGAENSMFQGRQGHLATITSEEENKFLLNFSFGSSFRHSWLGGVYKNGEWTWVTGEEWDYTSWGPDLPINPIYRPYLFRYLHGRINTLNWGNGLIGGTGRSDSFIVEYDTNPSTIPEPSTMLLFGMGCLGFAKVCREKIS